MLHHGSVKQVNKLSDHGNTTHTRAACFGLRNTGRGERVVYVLFVCSCWLIWADACEYINATLLLCDQVWSNKYPRPSFYDILKVKTRDEHHKESTWERRRLWLSKISRAQTPILTSRKFVEGTWWRVIIAYFLTFSLNPKQGQEQLWMYLMLMILLIPFVYLPTLLFFLLW